MKKAANNLNVCCFFCNFAFMEQLMLNFDYGKVVDRETTIRRRARTQPIGDCTISSRKQRVMKRNKVLVARYYYWTEIRRRRFDDVIKILSDYEFFVDDRTIQNALVDNDSLYRELLSNKYSARKLASLFPGFSWG